MTKDMRDLVRKGYNKGKYEQVYGRKNSDLTSFEKLMVDELSLRIAKNGKILDFGCGVGLPYDKALTKKDFLITGIDISEKHISLAKKNVRKAKFILGDFSKYQFDEKFNAIISFFAIFHIPRAEHKVLLKKMNYLLKKDGIILITLGADDMKCAVSNNFAGAKMAWSSFSVEKNKKMVEQAGFKILIAAEDYREERHLWILAKKK